MEAYLIDVLGRTFWQVANTLAKNWPFLLAGVIVAAFLRVHLRQETVSAALRRRTALSVAVATVVASATPL